jgi:LysM repeat protein
MTAGRIDRRAVKIRRRGRHSTPSQVEKVAQQAGKAAPAVAIAGALVTVAPGAQHALAAPAAPATATTAGQQAAGPATGSAPTVKASLDAFETRSVTVSPAAAGRHTAAATTTTYHVRSGDTLSKIADRFYHKAADWAYLAQVNAKTIPNPDVIYVGEPVTVPAGVPTGFTLAAYQPKHSKPAPAARSVGGGSGSSSKGKSSATRTIGGTADGGAVVVQAGAGGRYSCAGLESLWKAAGGNPADAVMAAEIAMAESGGNPNAISPTNDYGLWQINASNGSLATLSPSGSAHSAVVLSSNGSNWGPWTTFTSGAYAGKC